MPRKAARPRVRVKNPPILFDRTQDAIKRIQRLVPGRFLTYWTSTSGSVCDNDVMALHEILQQAGPQEALTLFVKSDGGSGMAALRLVHLLRRTPGSCRWWPLSTARRPPPCWRWARTASPWGPSPS